MSTVQIKKQLVTASGLGNVLGVSRQWVASLEERGVLPTRPDKQYLLCESVQAYLAHFKKEQNNIHGQDYESARARKMESSADLEKMKADKERGELVEISEVQNAVRAEYAVVRQRIFGIPTKIAMDVVHLETPQEIQKLLTSSINDALTELQYDTGE